MTDHAGGAADAATALAKLGPSGKFAVLGGVEQHVRLLNLAEVWLDADGVLARSLPLELVVRRRDGTHGPVVVVRRDAFDRIVARGVSAVWRGERLSVLKIEESEIEFYSWDAGPSWSAQVGAQFEHTVGTFGRAPLDELSDVQVEERQVALRVSQPPAEESV